jgi:MerR family transcriptional regulator, thiopeptide resistance regulator
MVDDIRGTMDRLYRAHEFAKLAGVTVRALHHYDRIGILKPQRSSSGYRLYGLSDLERLEQIAALRFLDIPLKEIKTLLGCNPLTLLESLRLQLRALTEKRDRIDRAIHAIKAAEKLAQADQPPDASVIRKIIEAIEMPPQEDFMKQYYTQEGWAKRTLLIKQTPPQNREGYQQNMKQLFLEVEAALDLDPASEAAQALASRWVLLVEGAIGGDAEVRAGAIKAWKDHRNWPEAEKDALLARYGLESSGDKNLSIMRVEQVAAFIGKAIGRKYYGALDSLRLAAINKKPPERTNSKLWVELFRDVESTLGESPASDRAQALATRWTELKRDAQPSPRPDAYDDVLRWNWPSDVSVSVVSQVARLYRIEQVWLFLKKALAQSKDRRDLA